MDGVAAIRLLLAAEPAVTAMVPATAGPGEQTRMSADPLPVDVELPALSLETISTVQRNLPAPGATRFVTERVQVTGHARNYRELRMLMKAVMTACADKRPEVAGLSNVSVQADGAGPQGISATTSARAMSQDFRVHYNEER